MPRQTGYFGHVKARNELSIFKHNAPPPPHHPHHPHHPPFNRTTAPADSTTDPMLNRKRKTDLKKKVKRGKKKKKRASSSSSSSSSDDSEDEDGLDPALYDLNTPLFSIAKYIKNPDEMVKEMFRSVEKSKLRNMLPENIKKIDVDELKSLCVQQLDGMSKKRIRSILSGQPMDGSSGSDSSEDSADEIPDSDEDEEKEEEDEIQPDSTSVGVDKNTAYEEISDEEGDEILDGAGDVPKKKGKDILELEMRARAIRSMLEKKKQKDDTKADVTKESNVVTGEGDEDEDMDFLKELLGDDDESPLEGDEEVRRGGVEEEEEKNPEERKMSVRKLAELKMKARQEETAADSSDGAAGTKDESAAAGDPDAGVKKKPEKNLQMKQAEILKKAAKLRKKKKKENVDGAVDDGTGGFKVNKAKLGQRSFRKRSGSTRQAENEDRQPYSHSYAAYIAAFGDPNMIEYSDSYGAPSHADGWQPRELTVEEEVRALLDELIYRVDPYGAEQIYSFYDNVGADGYGRPETETETFESSLMSRHGFGEHEDSVEPEPRPSSNNSGHLYTDFTEDNLTRDNTRDNSEDVSLSSDDEDRILDGEGMTKEELLRARIAKRRMAKKTTPNVPAERIKKVRKVREEKAITLEGLGGPPSHSHPHRLPPHMMGRFPPHPPSRLAAGPTAAQKKKKAEEDLEEGELSDDEESDGRPDPYGTHAAPFIPREAYYARKRMRKSPESEESGSESSTGRSRSRTPPPPRPQSRDDGYDRRRRTSSGERQSRSPYQDGYY